MAPEAVARAAEATRRAQTAELTMRMTVGGFGLPQTFTVHRQARLGEPAGALRRRRAASGVSGGA